MVWERTIPDPYEINVGNGVARIVTHKEEPIVYGQEYLQEYYRRGRTSIGMALNCFRMDLCWTYKIKSILDVGVGAATFLEKFYRDISWWCWGYDINPIMVQWLSSRGLYFNPLTGWPPNCEAISFWDSLEHMANPESILSCIPKGVYVLVTIPIIDDLTELKASKHYKPKEHLWYFTKEGFISLMTREGFTLRAVLDDEVGLGREEVLTFVFQKE